MYKAIQKIGGYEVGEEVPAEKAKLWLEMYSIPQVEEVDGEGQTSESEDATGQDSESEPEEKSSKDVMHDDYLGRNTNVVKKNVEEDGLSQKQLENLLKLEKSDKKRRVVIRAIEKRLNKF